MYWSDWSYGKNRMSSSLERLIEPPKKKNFFKKYCCFFNKKEDKSTNTEHKTIRHVKFEDD